MGGLIKGVPQGSVTLPVLFSIHLNNLFYLADFPKVCNFADGTTFHACDSDLNNLINRLEHNVFLVEWFETNNMKLNMSPLSFRDQYKNVWVKIGDEKILEKAQ